MLVWGKIAPTEPRVEPCLGGLNHWDRVQDLEFEIIGTGFRIWSLSLSCKGPTDWDRVWAEVLTYCTVDFEDTLLELLQTSAAPRSFYGYQATNLFLSPVSSIVTQVIPHYILSPKP